MGESRAELRARRAAPTHAWTRGDVLRQIAVAVTVCFAIVAAVFGAGLAGGTSISDVQGGALDADATLLAPGRPAFAIWSVIYLGLIGYAVWQALPAQRAAWRQRSLGWWIGGTAVLNGLWLLAAQYGPLWLTVAVIVLLLVVLCVTFHRAVVTAQARSSWTDLVLIDAVTGLYLGWVSVATVANMTAWLQPLVPASWVEQGTLIAIVLVVLVLAIGLLTSGLSGWRIAPGWAMAWGVLWIGIARLAGEPHSAPVGFVAIGVAVVLFAVPVVLRLAVALRSGD